MSHRYDCPTDYEARRRGKIDYERRGYRSYYAPDEIRDCPEAERAYQDGQRQAEYRAEEEAAERRAEGRRRHEREQYEQACRDDYYREYEQRQIDETYDRMFEEEREAAIAEVWGDGP